MCRWIVNRSNASRSQDCITWKISKTIKQSWRVIERVSEDFSVLRSCHYNVERRIMQLNLIPSLHEYNFGQRPPILILIPMHRQQSTRLFSSSNPNLPIIVKPVARFFSSSRHPEHLRTITKLRALSSASSRLQRDSRRSREIRIFYNRTGRIDQVNRS